MEKSEGVTLIELLFVIAIIGILSTLSYPSYLSYMVQTRRNDAKVMLIKAQLMQSHLHILYPYSDVAEEISLPEESLYYNFSIVSADNNHYLIKAVAKQNMSQVNDALACQTLCIDQDNAHTTDGELNNDECW